MLREINIMSEKKERRFLDRIKISGAQLSYRTSKEKGIFSRFSQPMPIEDLTWNSVRFKTEQYIKSGDVVEMEVLIPGESKLKVKGHLVWTSRAPGDDIHYAVVQLLPFGDGKQYNSLSLRQKLKTLISKYSNISN